MKSVIALITLAISLGGCSSQEPKENISLGSDEIEITEEIDRLNDSPRHHEWVEVKNNGKSIYTWVVYPEIKQKAPVVLIIHENKGLNDWAKKFADQVAEAGYIAVAPDLLSNFSESKVRTSDFTDENSATDALYQLKSEDIQSDLLAVAQYAKTIEAGNDKLVTAGFCWGGTQAFKFATQDEALDGVMVFYGTSPENTQEYANIKAPVYGFYGGDDERVNATISRAENTMNENNKFFEYKIYEGAGHAYMRSGEISGATNANKSAQKESFNRFKEIMKSL